MRATRLLVLGSLALSVACGTTVPLSQRTAPDSGMGDGLPRDQASAVPFASASAGAGASQLGPAGTASRTGATVQGSMPAAGSPGLPAGGSSSIPASGPGWDAKSIYLGIPTENDAHTAVQALGIQNFDPGDYPGMVTAAVDEVNREGGLFGRKLVPVFHDNSTAEIESNPDAVAQTNCATYTEDRRVVLVINALPAVNLPPCLAKAHMPDWETSSVLVTRSTFQKYGPYLWTMGEPAADVLGSAWIARLAAMHFFRAWDTSNGRPGSGPVKVGLLEPDTAEGRTVLDTMTAALRARGISSVPFLYTDSVSSYGSQMNSAILQFRSAGVTQVLNIPPIAAVMLVFMEAAERQQYRPAYGITSYDVPSTLAADAPAAQLAGAMGIGYNPASEVPKTQWPPADAAATRCDALMKKEGVNNDSDMKVSIARGVCAQIEFFVTVARAAGGLDAAALARGMAVAGPRFHPWGTFGSALSATTHWAPAAARDLSFNAGCTCFRYVSEPQRMVS